MNPIENLKHNRMHWSHLECGEDRRFGCISDFESERNIQSGDPRRNPNGSSPQRSRGRHAHRFVVRHVQKKEWLLAALRMGDLVDQAAQLVSLSSAWSQVARDARQWGATFSRMDTRDLTRYSSKKWLEFLVYVQEKIACHNPFAAGS